MTIANVSSGECLASETHPFVVAVPRLATYQRRSGIGRVLHSLGEAWSGRARLIAADLDVHPLPVLRNLPFGVRAPADADVVLLPQLGGAQALRDTRGVPSVAIVHDVGVVDFPGDRQALNWLTHWTLVRSLHGLRHASAIVAISRFTSDRLLFYLPELVGRVRVVPDGVGRPYLGYEGTQPMARQAIASQLGQALGNPVLLYVGSEHPRKNVALLLRVVQQFRQTHPSAQLVKVGGAGHPHWRRDTLAAAASCGLRIGRDVVLVEDVDDGILAHLYRAADAFITTSLYEGFCLPALEAMAVGTPVVASNRGALGEVVGDAGWLAEPDLAPMLDALCRAIADPDRSERVARGRLRASRMSWEQSAEQYLAIFRELSAHRGMPTAPGAVPTSSAHS